MDGSSMQLWKGSKHRAGWFGIFSQANSTSPDLQILESLPLNIGQTNTTAELGWGGAASAVASAAASAGAEAGYRIGPKNT